MEVGTVALESGKASKGDVTVEITKAICTLEDRVKTELVHGTVKINLDKLERQIHALGTTLLGNAHLTLCDTCMYKVRT